MKSVSILIVEDNADKAQKLKQTVLEVPGVSEKDITIVNSSVTAKRGMSEVGYDLLLLDIQIPNREGEAIIKDGGLKLWQTICRSNLYMRPAHVIAITSFKESHQNLAPEFAAESWMLIEYEPSSFDWADPVREKVEHVLTLKNQSAAAASDHCDVAIITALLEPELNAVLRLPYGWSSMVSERQSISYYHGSFTRRSGLKNKVIAASAPQMGMPAAVCLTMKVVQEFTPDYVIMVGIAAGLKSAGLGYGDILVSDPSWDWGSGKYAVDEGTRVFQPDPRPLRIDEVLADMCRRLSSDSTALAAIRANWPSEKPDTALALKVGPVATGASVVADEAWVENIKKNARKLIGIEMETYGVYYAVSQTPPPRPLVLSLKSVCDFADSKKNDKFQHYAAFTSVQAMRLLLEQYL